MCTELLLERFDLVRDATALAEYVRAGTTCSSLGAVVVILSNLAASVAMRLGTGHRTGSNLSSGHPINHYLIMSMIIIIIIILILILIVIVILIVMVIIVILFCIMDL